MKNEKNAVEAKKSKKIKITVSIAAAVVALTLAIALPILKINSDFDEIFEKMAQISDPEIIVTDMSAENVFGNTGGEARVISADLAARICALSEDFKYVGRDTDAMGAWDIRFRVRMDDGWLEIYLDEDCMYYVSGGVHYCFEPKNEETEAAYGDFLANVKKLFEK